MLRYRHPLLLLTLFVFPFLGKSQPPVDLLWPEKAQDQRPILLIFSGSDWCQPCMRLEKTLLSDSLFLHFAGEQLTLLRADFPQRKKRSAEELKRNEALAERYNPEGVFPKLLLLAPDHTVSAELEWKNLSPADFVEQIRSHTQDKN